MTIVLISFFLLLALLYFFQDKMIFFPQRLTAEESERIAHVQSQNSQIENISLKTEKHLHLRGWLVKNSNLQQSPLIIYFGGNAEELSYLIHYSRRIQGWSLALINYRGYGLSEGNPGEKNFCADATAIYDYFAGRPDIDKNRIVTMGRSLGTGVAVFLAKARNIKAVILVSPYDSLVSIGKEHFPFLPVRLLLRHRFDSLARAPLITSPLLVMVAPEDTIIPIKYSKRLAEKWGGPHIFISIQDEDHNTIHENEDYWKNINEFLAEVKADWK